MKVLSFFFIMFILACNNGTSIDKLVTIEGNSELYNSKCEIHYTRDSITINYFNRFEGKNFNKSISYKLIGDGYYLRLEDIEGRTTDQLFLSIKGDTSFTIDEYFGDTYFFTIQAIGDKRFKVLSS